MFGGHSVCVEKGLVVKGHHENSAAAQGSRRARLAGALQVGLGTAYSSLSTVGATERPGLGDISR